MPTLGLWMPKSLDSRIIVIGAGAAGLMAAAQAARRGLPSGVVSEVVLLEKANKTGVKILMSGGTRCNITHDTDARGITAEFGHARRFLQPSIGSFPPPALVDMLRKSGLETKVESTGKVFPTSDRALDVRNSLYRQAVDAGVVIRTGTTVTGIARNEGRWLVQTADQTWSADKVIVTVGGRSYPGCGTTGDGYGWLHELGHTIVPTRPALVPLVGGTRSTHELSGLTLGDVTVTVRQRQRKRPIAARRGSWLFTHFGFSGPAAMDVSGAMTASDSIRDLRLTVDLLPEIPEVQLLDQLKRRDGNRGPSKVAGVIGRWLPNRVADCLVSEADADVPIAELTRSGATRLVQQMKRWSLPITGTRGFSKAEVTAGGVQLSEVDPRTMESRIHPGLFIAGEVLDVDGPIGGYNFQAAFSTGRAAGIAAAQSTDELA